ncbi:hypothetical protein pb186bvf_007342 [Paramecium bursaria]
MQFRNLHHQKVYIRIILIKQPIVFLYSILFLYCCHFKGMTLQIISKSNLQIRIKTITKAQIIIEYLELRQNQTQTFQNPTAINSVKKKIIQMKLSFFTVYSKLILSNQFWFNLDFSITSIGISRHNMMPNRLIKELVQNSYLFFQLYYFSRLKGKKLNIYSISQKFGISQSI